ncbi:MAG: hypothetical protein LBE57_04070 [Methanosarcinales archaeon]|jgi:hypothetical protein|nr:hypothetical protein [Methanosarcinales archaeon]
MQQLARGGNGKATAPRSRKQTDVIKKSRCTHSSADSKQRRQHKQSAALARNIKMKKQKVSY